MSELHTQHENWKAARARLGMPVITPHKRRALSLPNFPVLRGSVVASFMGEPAAAYPAPLKIHQVQEILKLVAGAFSLSSKEIISSRRDGELIAPRHLAIMLAVHLTPHSLPAIGRYFNRDHTSVLHAARKMRPVLQAIRLDLAEEESTARWVAEAIAAWHQLAPILKYPGSARRRGN